MMSKDISFSKEVKLREFRLHMENWRVNEKTGY